MNLLRCFLAIGFAAVCGGCVQYATVAERRPLFHPAQAAATLERNFAGALERSRREPLAALGEYLVAAEAEARQLRRDPRDNGAREAYNFAVARVFTTLRAAHLEPWSQPLRVPAAGGDFTLTHRPDPRPQRNPALYDYTPADQFNIAGAYVAEHTVKPGLGAPLVAVGKGVRKDASKRFVPARTYYGITALARFGPGRRVVLAFEDPLEKETTTLDGSAFPLAADFTVPLAVMLARENPRKLEIARVLRPDKYAETAHIVRLQPFDPAKTVVIVVHGLMDSPATWTPMLNTLRGDPFVRQNFQFWYYSYPSGYPYPYSAAIFRQELDAIEKVFPSRKPIVLVGHSMGSLIARLTITDTGDRLWLKMFGKPPGQTRFSARSRQLLEDSLIFRSRPEIGRVIFISGPHRGSDLANNWIGRLASKLIHAPTTLLKVSEEMRKLLTVDANALRLTGMPNSVDTLAPNNRFVRAIATIPIAPGVPYHSIIGDRGRGDTPESSDGVVSYSSSHLDGAQSERIVPANHSAHQNREAIEEVRRILRLHAGR